MTGKLSIFCFPLKNLGGLEDSIVNGSILTPFFGEIEHLPHRRNFCTGLSNILDDLKDRGNLALIQTMILIQRENQSVFCGHHIILTD